MKADLYCRVSTAEQAQEGYSIGEQEARLRAFAEAQGWEIHACHIDPGFSGAKMDRPGLQAVIRDAEQHKIEKVITYKLDRLSRSQKDTLHLIEDIFLPNGVDYVSMTESFDSGTSIGRAILGVLSTFAQLEREQIAERMMMGRVASAKEGNWHGGSGVPIGYRYIPKTHTEPGKLVVDPDEAEIIRTIYNLFLAGMTFHGIYDYCAERYTTSYGSFGGGGANLIPNILQNRTYIGEIKYEGVWYKSKHEPIITEQTFRRVQDKLVEYRATLDEHRRMPFQTGHLLTGFLFCAKCGARWAYHSCSYRKKNGDRIIYGTYTCYTKQAHKKMRGAESCPVPVWKANDLEQIVWDEIEKLKIDGPQKPKQQDTTKPIIKKLAALDKQQARLVDLYVLGTMPMEHLQRKNAELERERQTLQDQLRVAENRSTGLTAKELQAALKSAEQIRNSGDLQQQRDLLRLLIRRITLDTDRQIAIEWNI